MQTPYYEIDEGKLNQDICGLRCAMEKNWGSWGVHSIAACSVKTNSLPWLLNHFRRHGFYAEVVSTEEYDLVRRIGFEPSHIIYNGPIKDRDLFFRVLRDGGMVNLDSSQEIGWLEEAVSEEKAVKEYDAKAANCPEILRVGLRVNIDFHRLVPDEVPADEEGSRFGYCEENGELAAVIGRIRRLQRRLRKENRQEQGEDSEISEMAAGGRQYADIRIAGLHLHSSTKSRSVKAYAAVADFAGRIASRYDLIDEIEYIDMGGGYYGGVPGKPTFDDYLPAIVRGLNGIGCDLNGAAGDLNAGGGGLRHYFDPKKVKLIMEPGVSMVSSSFSFVTSVRDIKKIGEHIYVVIDGSRLNLNPQVTRRWYPHHIVRFPASGADSGIGEPAHACMQEHSRLPESIARQRGIPNGVSEEWSSRCATREPTTGSSIGNETINESIGERKILPSQEVVGATCMEYDRLFEIKGEPELRIGDFVVFDLAGGYTLCLTPLFIHYFPAVYVKMTDGTVFTAREPWTNEEFLQKNYW